MINNSIYNLVGGLVRLGLGLLSAPLLLVWLGAKTYGLYVIILSIINFALVFETTIPIIFTVFIAGNATNNLPNTITQEEIIRVCLWMIVFLSATTLAILYSASPFIVAFFDHLTPDEQLLLANGIKFSSFIVAIRLLQQFFIGIEQANGNFKLFNVLNSLFNITQTVSILLITFFSHNITFLLYTQLIIALAFTGIHAFVCFRKKLITPISFWGIPDKYLAKSMAIYAGRSGLSSVGILLFSQGDKLIVGKLIGLESAGIYAAITALTSQINSLSALPVQPVISEVSRIKAKAEYEQSDDSSSKTQLSGVLSKTLQINSFIAFGCGCIIVLLAPELIQILFKNVLTNVDELIFSLRVITIIYTIYSLNAVGYYVLYATHNELENTVIVSFSGILSLCLIAWLGTHFGLIGALLGNIGYLTTLYLPFRAFHRLNLPKILLFQKWYLPFLLLSVSVLTCFLSGDFWIRTFVVLCIALYLPSKYVKLI